MIIPSFRLGKSTVFCNARCYGKSSVIVHKTNSMYGLELTATNITGTESEVEEDLEED